MIAVLDRIASLSVTERREYLQAALLVAAIRVGLWIIPYRHLRKLADGPVRRARCSGVGPALERIRRHVISVSRFIPNATCLPQALAASILIRHAGIASQLRLGVTHAGGRFRAHAWVESEGRVVVGDVPELAEFRVLN